MSDARSLLRAHRAANRVEHPHAAYSDAGKLLCKLCHEAVKTDALWESHVKGPGHRQKEAALHARQTASAAAPENGNKRKHDDVDDAMSDAADGEAEDDAEAVRKKRSRTDMVAPVAVSTSGAGIDRDAAPTPPGLVRRPSSTPVQGVEIAIPSRPATPLVGDVSANSTPKPANHGRSPLIGSGSGSGSDSAITPNKTNSAGFVSQGRGDSISTEAISATQTVNGTTVATTTAAAGGDPVDEAEWAAFEADIAAADAPAPTSASYADAIISAPALTATQLAAKSLEEENERKEHSMDAQMADEKEDAARAMETEFEEMEELEGRVRKLKERREELRKESVANLRGRAALDSAKDAGAPGKENLATVNGGGEESDDDELDDDWEDGFRFRA